MKKKARSNYSIKPPFPSVGSRMVAILLDTFLIVILGQLLRQGYFGSFLKSLSLWGALSLTSGVYVMSGYWTLSSTYGKIVLGMRIVDETGRKMGFMQATLRAMCMVLGALPVFLGYFYAVVDPRRQSFHDKVARTLVVFDES